jgi:hypothetical protein
LVTVEVVVDESETAAAPAITNDNAKALITNFIGSNLNVKEFGWMTSPTIVEG